MLNDWQVGAFAFLTSCNMRTYLGVAFEFLTDHKAKLVQLWQLQMFEQK